MDNDIIIIGVAVLIFFVGLVLDIREWEDDEKLLFGALSLATLIIGGIIYSIVY